MIHLLPLFSLYLPYIFSTSIFFPCLPASLTTSRLSYPVLSQSLCLSWCLQSHSLKPFPPSLPPCLPPSLPAFLPKAVPTFLLPACLPAVLCPLIQSYISCLPPSFFPFLAFFIPFLDSSFARFFAASFLFYLLPYLFHSFLPVTPLLPFSLLSLHRSSFLLPPVVTTRPGLVSCPISDNSHFRAGANNAVLRREGIKNPPP